MTSPTPSRVLKNLLPQLLSGLALEIVGERRRCLIPTGGPDTAAEARPDAVFLGHTDGGWDGFDLIVLPVLVFFIITGYNGFAAEALRCHWFFSSPSTRRLVKAVEKSSYRDTDWNHRLSSIMGF